MNRFSLQRRQSGLTYIEILVAAAIVVIALLPAMDGLYTAMQGADAYADETAQHYAALAKMEDMLAEPYALLTAAAEVAGAPTVPSSYSDAAGVPDQRLVFVALYDADNSDGDGDVFTVADPDLDDDDNPFTGYHGVIWLRVEMQGTSRSLESLVAP